MKTATSLKAEGHLVYNYVTAYKPSTGFTVAVRPGGQGIWVDDSQPITLERWQRLYTICCEAEGEELGKIHINMYAYEHDGKDEGPNPQIWQKIYTYDPEHAYWTVHENNTLVYENQNGNVHYDVPLVEKPKPNIAKIFKVQWWTQYGINGGMQEHTSKFFLSRENAEKWIGIPSTDYDTDLFLTEWQESLFGHTMNPDDAHTQTSYRIVEINTADHEER